MSDLADVLFSTLGLEAHALGQMKLPVSFEGQIRLIGILELDPIFHKGNGDVRWMEATHMANQDIVHPKLSWLKAVHLNLGWSYNQNGGGNDATLKLEYIVGGTETMKMTDLS